MCFHHNYTEHQCIAVKAITANIISIDFEWKSNKGSFADVSFLFGQARKPTLRQLKIGSATSGGIGRLEIDIRNAPFISDLEILTMIQRRISNPPKRKREKEDSKLQICLKPKCSKC